LAIALHVAESVLVAGRSVLIRNIDTIATRIFRGVDDLYGEIVARIGVDDEKPMQRRNRAVEGNGDASRVSDAVFTSTQLEITHCAIEARIGSARGLKQSAAKRATRAGGVVVARDRLRQSDARHNVLNVSNLERVDEERDTAVGARGRE
jgi:hypothetical protein